jgi:hypothetical protein
MADNTIPVPKGAVLDAAPNAVPVPQGATVDGVTPPAEAPYSVSAKTKPESEPSFLDTIGQSLKSDASDVGDLATGVLKGTGNTLYHSSKLVREGLNHIPLISDAVNSVAPQFPDQDPDEINPKNLMQKVGFGGEQIAEFIAPAGWVGKGEKLIDAAVHARQLPKILEGAIGLGTKALGEGGLNAGMEVLHGGNADDVQSAAGIGAAMPFVGKLLSPVGNYLTQKVSPNIMNRLVGTLKAERRLGHNPGRALSELGITGNSLDELGNNIQGAIDDTHGQVKNALTSNPTRINVLPALNAEIDGAMKTARNNSSTELLNKLEAIKQRFTHNMQSDGTPYPQQRSNMHLTLEQIHDLKKDIFDAMGGFTPNKIEQEADNLRWRMGNSLSNIVDSNLGKIANGDSYRELNRQEAELIGAKKSLQNKILTEANKSGLSFMDAVLGGGALSTMAAGVHAPAAVIGGGAAIGARHLYNSPAVQSRLGASVMPAVGAATKGLASGAPTRAMAAGAISGATRNGQTQKDVLPPEATQQLEEGYNTTFANGQVWTMSNGKPKRLR